MEQHHFIIEDDYQVKAILRTPLSKGEITEKLNIFTKQQKSKKFCVQTFVSTHSKCEELNLEVTYL